VVTNAEVIGEMTDEMTVVMIVVMTEGMIEAVVNGDGVDPVQRLEVIIDEVNHQRIESQLVAQKNIASILEALLYG